ncbi:AfsR family transcriptional regulator [Streptomyces albus]|uniref:AfsR family transcriptional regulator n=1 Tax=Streptomyces albus (strain ATCC 21838 / DSM 41398 / FERM P-419 / JCM 4703 / NBRC 107858) TaxID=1081613 RepID=A0A0B5F1N0_STRA4|nr:AfsR family transcriptional regulator [Streptomyces albus]AOU79087.1 AfsR family transcriptional regulator [Streptomyces albus]AYN34820.1 tetratricopeptide repeat-containing protein [Streptomyces albus]
MDEVNNGVAGGTQGVVLQGAHNHIENLVLHGPAARNRRIPRMLPYAPEEFVDREEQRAALDRLSATRAGRTSPLVAALTGPPGVGTSGLLAHWANSPDRLGEFPGGIFYYDLSAGASVPVDPMAVLECFLAELEVPRAELSSVPEVLAAHFRSFTSVDPCLVLLDGVARPGQVRPLLPGHPQGMVLVASGSRLSGLGQAVPSRPAPLPVGALDEAACTELFLRFAGRPEGAEPEAVRAVVGLLGGLPGAARIAGVLAADPFGGGVEELARRLRIQRSSLEVLTLALDEDEPDGAYDQSWHSRQLALRSVWATAYQTLGPAARHTYRALGLNPTPEFADGLLRALAGGEAAGERVRRQLLEAQLVEPAGPGRCRMPRFGHEYARELPEDPERDAAALTVLLDWYLRRTTAAAHQLSRRWHFGPLFAEPALLTGELADRDQALAAMTAELDNASAAVRLAHDRGQYAAATRLTEALRDFYFPRGQHSHWLEVCRWGLKAAEALPEDAALVRARMQYELAFCYVDRGAADDLTRAAGHYQQALDQARLAGHPRTGSSALEGLGQIAVREGRPEEAMDLFAQAAEALEGVDHPRGRVLLGFHRGNAASAAGRHQEAAALLESAHRDFAALPDPVNAAKSLSRLGGALLAGGRPEEALGRLGEALAAHENGTVHAPKDRADALLLRGDVHHAAERPEPARADWESALALYRDLGSLRAEEALRRLAALDGPGTGGGAPGRTGVGDPGQDED